MKLRGVFEKVPGSGVHWIRYPDPSGRIRREKVGPKSAAIKLYQKRKTKVLQGKKLPEQLRRRVVRFSEIADDAEAYCEANNRNYKFDYTASSDSKRSLEIVTQKSLSKNLGVGLASRNGNRERTTGTSPHCL